MERATELAPRFLCIYPGRIIKNRSKRSYFDFILRTIYKDEEKLIFAMLLKAKDCGFTSLQDENGDIWDRNDDGSYSKR